MNSFTVRLSIWLPWLFPPEHSVESSSSSRLLLCNDKVLKIQPNLYDLLIRLRQQRRSLPLWIDAICINQDEADDQAREEKYRQIRLMKDIYGSAIRVIVWLGESKNISATLPSLIEEVPPLDFEYRDIREENQVLRSKDNLSAIDIFVQVFGLEGPLWKMLRTAYRRRKILELSKLANRDYFQRVWVVQELVLAKELHFLVGPLHLPWESMQKGHQMIAAFDSQPTLALNDLKKRGFLVLPHIIKAREDREVGKIWPIDDFLLLVRDRVATCQEDKVFSVLGLIDDSMAEVLTKDVMHDGRPRLDKLFFNCAVTLARERGWPYVLSLVALGSAECADLPSWVPDLRQPLRPKPFWYYGSTHLQAGRGANTLLPGDFAVSMEAGSTNLALEVPMATVDVIVQVGESHDEINETQSSRMQGHIFDLLNRLGTRYSHTGELTLDALFRTLTADVFARDPNRSMAHLRFEFGLWMTLTFELIETPVLIPFSGRISDWYARQHGISTVRDTPLINGKDISLSTTIDDFVKIHDNAAYHMAGIFNREKTSRPWIPEQPRNPDSLRAVGMPEQFWEGGFTVAKLLDAITRTLNVGMKGVPGAIDQVYKDRRVFRTSRGYLGCGPRDVRLGDVVCLVGGGAPTPFVFRSSKHQESFREGTGVVPLAEDLGTVRVVGEAYVHGCMNGELSARLHGQFAGVKVV